VGFAESRPTYYLAPLQRSLACKIACNIDPLRGGFRVQS
jgi:hypothetical protein